MLTGGLGGVGGAGGGVQCCCHVSRTQRGKVIQSAAGGVLDISAANCSGESASAALGPRGGRTIHSAVSPVAAARTSDPASSAVTYVRSAFCGSKKIEMLHAGSVMAKVPTDHCSNSFQHASLSCRNRRCSCCPLLNDTASLSRRSLKNGRAFSLSVDAMLRHSVSMVQTTSESARFSDGSSHRTNLSVWATSCSCRRALTTRAGSLMYRAIPEGIPRTCVNSHAQKRAGCCRLMTPNCRYPPSFLQW